MNDNSVSKETNETKKNEKLLDVLIDLAQLDIDAVSAYEQDIEKIDDQIISKSIENFRDDHLRHIDDLSQMIEKFGGSPPERTRDLKGFVISGFTALYSITGLKGTLKAMESNEETTNKNYKNALLEGEKFPEEIISLLEKNYEDEQRHLSYIQETLKKLA